jgi:hypothetical protein
VVSVDRSEMLQSMRHATVPVRDSPLASTVSYSSKPCRHQAHAQDPGQADAKPHPRTSPPRLTGTGAFIVTRSILRAASVAGSRCTPSVVATMPLMLPCLLERAYSRTHGRRCHDHRNRSGRPQQRRRRTGLTDAQKAGNACLVCQGTDSVGKAVGWVGDNQVRGPPVPPDQLPARRDHPARQQRLRAERARSVPARTADLRSGGEAPR